MARLKTAYRPNISAVKIDGEQPEATVGMGAHIPGEDATAEAAKADEAAQALKRQIEALKQSEAMQRQHQAAQAAQPPPTRDQLLHLWRTQGMAEPEEAFLRENPEMIDHAAITALAANEAAQVGHQRGTEAHRHATREIFHQHLADLQSQARAAQPTPAIFQPPPPPDRAAIYSAPVSRRDIGGVREPSPSSVRLSPEEKEIAAVSGLSQVEYARHKLRLEAEKRRGERQQ